MTKTIFIGLITFGLVIPFFALAGNLSGPIVPCGRTGQNPCTLCDIFVMIQMIIDFVTAGLFVLAGIFVAVGGVRILASAGSPEHVEAGKKMITYAITGIVIALLSWVILNMLFLGLFGENKGFQGPWNKIRCVGGGITDYGYQALGGKCYSSLNKCPVPSECYACTSECIDGTDCTGGGGGGGNCSGTFCSAPNFCSPIQDNCSISQVNNWNAQIQAAASGKSICSGINTVKMIKAIMARESGGSLPSTSPAGAAGLMQLLPSTANYWKVGPYQCAPNDNIDQAWLNNPANATKSICIAIDFMRSLVADCGCDARQIAAGYNGGGGIIGACFQSTNCGNCLGCSGETFTRRWECLWDDNQHTICNTGYAETRNYAPRVASCYNQF